MQLTTTRMYLWVYLEGIADVVEGVRVLWVLLQGALWR